jgi:cob(I)alamin adenosyltransferase
LNRLGDYFYLLTRYINYQVGMEDYLWFYSQQIMHTN